MNHVSSSSPSARFPKPRHKRSTMKRNFLKYRFDSQTTLFQSRDHQGSAAHPRDSPVYEVSSVFFFIFDAHRTLMKNTKQPEAYLTFADRPLQYGQIMAWSSLVIETALSESHTQLQMMEDGGSKIQHSQYRADCLSQENNLKVSSSRTDRTYW